MNNPDILKYIQENPIDLAFREKNNYHEFIKFVDSEDLINGIESFLNVKHHISFHYGTLDKSSTLLYGECVNARKRLEYYEDLCNNYVVDLI